MCSHDDYVSPSLRRRLRTHEEIVREEGSAPSGPKLDPTDIGARRSTMSSRLDEKGVSDGLAAIPGLPRAALIERWTEAYGRPPLKGISRRLLEYAAAYHLQVQALGGLNPAVLRKLRRPAGSGQEGAPAVSRPGPNKTLLPGSRLVRNWNGRSHAVEVTDNGFLYGGRQYRSLSAVARTITGARWSGPRFFGL